MRSNQVRLPYDSTRCPRCSCLAASAPAPARQRSRPPRPDDAAIVHALNRLTYGPRPGDVERVRAMGLQKWIEPQLTPSRIDNRALDAKLQRLETLTLDSQTIQREYAAPAMAERRQRAQKREHQGQTDRARRRKHSRLDRNAERMMRGRRARLSAKSPGHRRPRRSEVAARRLQRAAARRSARRFLVQPLQRVRRQGRDAQLHRRVRARSDSAVRARQLPDMLGATAKSPAMLFYLDNWLLSAQGAATVQQGGDGACTPVTRCTGCTGTRASREAFDGLNENYARELLELHTLGVDGGYTQQDIVNVAQRVHRLDDAAAAGIGHSCSCAGAARSRREDRARPDDQGRRRHRRRRARARHRGRASVNRPPHRDEARDAFCQRRRRRPRSSIARPRRSPRRSGDLREVAEGDPHLAGILRRRTRIAQR